MSSLKKKKKKSLSWMECGPQRRKIENLVYELSYKYKFYLSMGDVRPPIVRVYWRRGKK